MQQHGQLMTGVRSQCIKNDILVFRLRQMNMLCVEKVKLWTDATCELIIMEQQQE